MSSLPALQRSMLPPTSGWRGKSGTQLNEARACVELKRCVAFAGVNVVCLKWNAGMET